MNPLEVACAFSVVQKFRNDGNSYRPNFLIGVIVAFTIKASHILNSGYVF